MSAWPREAKRPPLSLPKARFRVENLLGPVIFGTGEDSLESVLIRLLTAHKKTLAVAESCTGGFLAHRLTNVPGASAVFLGGVVAYSNQVKQDLLGVSAETLRRHGAVSEPVARAMADGRSPPFPRRLRAGRHRHCRAWRRHAG